MIADLKPYPEYKESGLAWLGNVPGHWRVDATAIVWATKPNRIPRTSILEVSLKTGVQVRDFENSSRKQIMSDIGKYKRAAKGDVAYNMMRMWQGAAGVSPVDGLVSPAYVVAQPYPVPSQFFVTLFRTARLHVGIDNCSRGIRQGPQSAVLERTSSRFRRPPAARRAGGDCAVSGLGERAAGAGDPGEAEGDRAAQRAEAGHHPPRRHPRPRPLRPPQTLRHPLARRHSAALGDTATQVTMPICHQRITRMGAVLL